MGRPRVKIIDDAQEEAENKASSKTKRAKSESAEVFAEKIVTNENKAVVDDSAVKSHTEEKVKTQSSKKQKPGKTKPRSKKYQELIKDLDRTKTYSLAEAVDMAKKMSYSKFNATLEAHINTAQTGIRGLVSLPYAAGRNLRILAFGKGAEQSGADIFGSDETIEEINKQSLRSNDLKRSLKSSQSSDYKGKLDFDIIVTTPEWMPKLTKVARILGPRGLMPNPKNGTITSGEAGLKKAVEGFQAGKTEYKTESKAPVIHLALGKIDQPNEELIANIKTLYQTIGKSRIKKISLSPTMGPSVKLDLNSI